MLIQRYDLEAYDFRAWACRALDCDDLGTLHHRQDPADFENYVDRLRHYVSCLEAAFIDIEPLYVRFVDAVVAPLFGELATVQHPPSFRCHLVGGGSCSALHRDGDSKYNVTPGVLNAWLPLTPVSGTSSLFVETAFGSGRLRPVTLEPGEVLFFDAFHLAHGSIGNRTETTRVSFDLRFLPADLKRGRRLYARASPLRNSPIDPASMVFELD